MSMLPGKQRAEHARERWPDDWYVEPRECVFSLFDAVRFVGVIHDPACGAGNIPKCGHDLGFKATGSDLVDRGFGSTGVDFLMDNSPRWNIVTNPPYKLATQFVLHALQVTALKVAVLVRLTFLAGQHRNKVLFTPHPPATVLVLSTRPSMPPGGTNIPAKGGTIDYCWIVWDNDHDAAPVTKWRR